MREYAKSDLIKALKELTLKKGDIVLVSTELFTLGVLKGAKNKNEYCAMILDAIFDVIGRGEGTVVAHAYTTYTGRYGIPFDYEHSRPITGLFSEYVLFHPESVRSLHPINSVAAIGKHKHQICDDVSSSNYGLDSPPDRMYKMGCKVLRLGIDYAFNVFSHYIETVYGAPYLYNKLLDIETIVDGKKVDKKFFASVWHLELDLVYDFERLRKVLLERGYVNCAEVGAGKIYCIDSRRYCDTLLELMKRDPYILLKYPPNFKKGEKPFDGVTKGRDGIEEDAQTYAKDMYRKNDE